jgi:uncharacterized membrane protein YfcA
MLTYAFRMQDMPPDSIHIMAVATSMACIVFTSLSSTRAHNARGAVDWAAWRGIAPGVLVGTFCGTWVAVLLSKTALQGFFILFLVFVGTQMALNFKPKASRHLPGPAGLSATGGAIGVISSLVGIGGGTMSVPFLTLCNVPFHTCIGTSAAISLPIAVAGSLGYVVNGRHFANLPDYTLGLVYLPACLGIVVASTIFARLGAALAHRLPTAGLKRIFACFIFVVAAEMLYRLSA